MEVNPGQMNETSGEDQFDNKGLLKKFFFLFELFFLLLL
jgi:hypothetical protein